VEQGVSKGIAPRPLALEESGGEQIAMGARDEGDCALFWRVQAQRPGSDQANLAMPGH
jgi:hypothetical protein